MVDGLVLDVHDEVDVIERFYDDEVPIGSLALAVVIDY